MTTTGSSAVGKRLTRGTGGRKTANRLARYAGGSDSEQFLAAAKNINTSGGITAGLASLAAADGQRFVEAPTAAIAPHPYNDPIRSAPQPESSRWTELVDSVRAAGVQVPILLVSRTAFVQARPTLEAAIGPDAHYVIIYGHRRRAAALAAGLETIPAVVDDAVLADGGDLDAMTIENLGREDLTELQQAEMFAHYSEAGLGQRAIAEKLGVNQSTVSRRLSLLLLAPEVLNAVEQGKIRSTEAAELAGKLPFGPARPWQQETDLEQGTAHRHADQLAAYALVVAGTTPKRAAERILVERRARQQAASEGVEIIDPQALFGPDFQRHAVMSPTAVDGAVVASIDPLQGGLVYYPAASPGARETSPEAAPQPAPEHSPKLRTAATKARRAACPRLVASPPPRDKLLPLLAGQYASGVTALAASPAGWSLAFEFSRAAGLETGQHPDVTSYRAAATAQCELKRHLEIAWACAVAGFELHAADKARNEWNHIDSAYLQLLQERANYSPTPWEKTRIKTSQTTIRARSSND
ncbi:ParB/RepB/Spo0J family partition protein (plasmid) [Mycobacterium sp. Aquia_216]|uniref:ParB/RepB/Spo0J family partition protein n=1 Tax=Mycobacterium sp. Aquia_216 TaxID=2991729 RepID=UPI00227BB909|nr:ParB/RepB/Spo0J family partition protein [Mycobacterium sp. Aquia_216]WAJ47945.1 ParB/RepB/Spo0J family partition protein [Mycobacterium sp. Aquia_216]